jgi:hypothetical protein
MHNTRTTPTAIHTQILTEMSSAMIATAGNGNFFSPGTRECVLKAFAEILLNHFGIRLDELILL